MSNKFEALKQHPAENSDNDSGDDELGPNIADLGPVEYPPGEHRLQHPYCLWFSKRPSRAAQGTEGYSQSLRLVGQVGTVEQWWALYSHIVRLQDIAPHRDVHLFKKGIMPMWEDPANRKGGKWVIRLRKDYGSRAWENLCLAMLGEQFMVKCLLNLQFIAPSLTLCSDSICSYAIVSISALSELIMREYRAGNEICGVVVSTRYQECLLNIWNRTASDMVTTNRIRDALKRLLNMPASATMEYKVHSDCLKASKTIITNNTFKS